MKLVKVHIKNYRSIIDSGEIEIEKIKTIFVGINEAGKTALLKAINQLNPASEIEEISLLRDFEPYRVCRRPLFLRECPDEKSKIHP